MIMGHYAAALLPHGRLWGAPLGLLLLCANLPDFLWLALALAGIEPVRPASFLDVTIRGLETHMIYSHGAVYGIGIAAAAVVAGLAITRRREVALWCGALVALHYVADFLSGFAHEVYGPGSPKIGLNLFQRSPYLAVVIEAAWSAACVWLYHRWAHRRGETPAPRRRIFTYLVFVGGSLAFIGTAERSLRQLLFR